MTMYMQGGRLSRTFKLLGFGEGHPKDSGSHSMCSCCALNEVLTGSDFSADELQVRLASTCPLGNVPHK